MEREKEEKSKEKGYCGGKNVSVGLKKTRCYIRCSWGFMNVLKNSKLVYKHIELVL